MRYLGILCLCFLKASMRTSVGAEKVKPNIIVIIADDLGWNDVGFHGSNEIPTQNIDALAYNGIILNKHYVLPTCTPSRASFVTGKYAIRTGLQGDPGGSYEPWGLPLNHKILPQYMKEQGYKTHLIGKWHLGFYQTPYTPTQRGFDSHFGYYNGWIRYNDSVVVAEPYSGIDARRNLNPAGDEFFNKYATDVFTNEAVEIIKRHDERTPLFMVLSQPAVHAIRGNILQVRNEEQNNRDFANVTDKQRRLLAGTLRALDDSVGAVMKALEETGMLGNSVVLFMSDNGGPTKDPDWLFENAASNWPLRGMKTSLHEGGVRGAAAIWSPLFRNRYHVSNQLFHISDWLPTFVAAAGGNLQNVTDIDGINQWDLLTGNSVQGKRQEVLVNINHERGYAAIIRDKWKLIRNEPTHQPSFADSYDGVSGREKTQSYNLEGVLTSITNRVISGSKSLAMGVLFLHIRSEAKIDSKCMSRISCMLPLPSSIQCENCLFDLENDPCEFINVAEYYPGIVAELKNRLAYFETISVPQIRMNSDIRANPANWGGYWSPWLDEKIKSASVMVTKGILGISVTMIICRKINGFLTAV